MQLPRRRHAGDTAGSSAAGPTSGRDSFTPKLASRSREARELDSYPHTRRGNAGKHSVNA